MLPVFNEHGYLPAGIHAASLEEVVERFGQSSELRRAEAQSLQWLIPLARAAGISRIIINGSFVTDAVEPNDVDCLLLLGENYRVDSTEARGIREGLPFLEIKIVTLEDFAFFVETMFATDRNMIPKGVVEVTP